MTEIEKVNHLMQWKDGNGAVGAEKRLQALETRLNGCVDKDEMKAIKRQLNLLTIAIYVLVFTAGPEAIKGAIEIIGRIF